MTVYRRFKEVKCPEWDPSKLGNSYFTREIFKCSDYRLLPTASPIVVAKCCAIVSCCLERQRLCIVNVTPTRQLKSFTSEAAYEIVDKKLSKYVGSDFTMNSLKDDKDLIKEGICYLINDVTVLFASKAKRTKDRLVGGLSELVSDERYIYKDALGGFELRGPVTFIMNITAESYQKNKERMIGSTLLERTLTIYDSFSMQEAEEWTIKEERAKHTVFKYPTISYDDIETRIKEIPHHFLRLINIRAREFSHLSMRSFVGTQDIIKSLLRSHAALNQRKRVCFDDFYFLSLIKPYLVDPFNPTESRIIQLRGQGMGYTKICEEIKWPSTCRQQVKRIILKAKMRGILLT